MEGMLAWQVDEGIGRDVGLETDGTIHGQLFAGRTPLLPFLQHIIGWVIPVRRVGNRQRLHHICHTVRENPHRVQVAFARQRPIQVDQRVVEKAR